MCMINWFHNYYFFVILYSWKISCLQLQNVNNLLKLLVFTCRKRRLDFTMCFRSGFNSDQPKLMKVGFTSELHHKKLCVTKQQSFLDIPSINKLFEVSNFVYNTLIIFQTFLIPSNRVLLFLRYTILYINSKSPAKSLKGI